MNNKNKLSTREQFMEDIHKSLAQYYSKQLSDNIKRGLARKKELQAKQNNK